MSGNVSPSPCVRLVMHYPPPRPAPLRHVTTVQLPSHAVLPTVSAVAGGAASPVTEIHKHDHSALSERPVCGSQWVTLAQSRPHLGRPAGCRTPVVRRGGAADTDLQRRVAPFRVVSDFQPAGDQPAAIDELERRVRAGETQHGAARRHRHRQVGDDRLADRAAAAPDAGDGAQQDPRRPAGQRVPRAAARTTRSSTSSRTTTTTSPRRTSRRRTPTSRRTPRSTRRSSGCGTRRPTACSPGAT